jgi:hypothetical protein
MGVGDEDGCVRPSFPFLHVIAVSLKCRGAWQVACAVLGVGAYPLNATVFNCEEKENLFFNLLLLY